MTAGKLLDLLIAYDEKSKIEIEIYDRKTGKYLATDTNSMVDDESFDLVFRAKV